MKRIIQFIACYAIVAFSCHAFAVMPNTSSITGYWKTIDDVTNKPKAIVQIAENTNGTVYGRILKIYPRPGYDQHELCTACQGERHNKQIVGMIFLERLKQNKDNKLEWNNGQILDPKNGKTYHCNVRLIDGGQKLSVRGYIGIPLFGRSQIWLRVSHQE